MSHAYEKQLFHRWAFPVLLPRATSNTSWILLHHPSRSPDYTCSYTLTHLPNIRSLGFCGSTCWWREPGSEILRLFIVSWNLWVYIYHHWVAVIAKVYPFCLFCIVTFLRLLFLILHRLENNIDDDIDDVSCSCLLYIAVYHNTFFTSKICIFFFKSSVSCWSFSIFWFNSRIVNTFCIRGRFSGLFWRHWGIIWTR